MLFWFKLGHIEMSLHIDFNDSFIYLSFSFWDLQIFHGKAAIMETLKHYRIL